MLVEFRNKNLVRAITLSSLMLTTPVTPQELSMKKNPIESYKSLSSKEQEIVLMMREKVLDGLKKCPVVIVQFNRDNINEPDQLSKTNIVIACVKQEGAEIKRTPLGNKRRDISY